MTDPRAKASGSKAQRIDAHQHFWLYDPKEQPFIDDSMSVLKQDFLPEALLPHLTAAGLSGCVAVQAAQTLEETRFLLTLADQADFIRAVVGWVDLRAPELSDVLSELTEHPRLAGVRHIVQAEPDDFFTDPAFHSGVALLPEYKLTYDMLVYERQLPLASAFMSRLGQVQFVLDHLGKPNLRKPDVKSFLEKLAPVAALPNVVCKLSGLITEADWDAWTPDALRPYLDGAVSLFGTERLLFGSDWPVCLLAGSYADVYGIIDDYFRAFSAAERDALFGGNALRTYGIRPAAALRSDLP